MLSESLPGPSLGSQRLAEGHVFQPWRKCRSSKPRQSSHQSFRSNSAGRGVVRAALQADVLQYRVCDPVKISFGSLKLCYMSCYWTTREMCPPDVSREGMILRVSLVSWLNSCCMLMILQDIEYDPRRNSEYWQTRPVAVLKRSLEIGMHAHTPMLRISSQCNQLSLSLGKTRCNAHTYSDCLLYGLISGHFQRLFASFWPDGSGVSGPCSIGVWRMVWSCEAAWMARPE